jgi:16S rRNA (uracil1498-N3)-methyltransferase
MQIFYVPDIEGKKCLMDPNESRHCIKVLRMRKGDKVNLIDGKGSMYEGIITDPDPKACEIEITRTTKNFSKREYQLTIAISPVKNQERFEWFVEKSVEFGIDEITPLICRNSEKTVIKKERLKNIIVAAVKQSVKAFIPALNDPVEFNNLIVSDKYDIKLIAHCNKESERHSIGEVCGKNKNVLILIGPEGDFSPEEIKLAIKNGFVPVHLGPSRLRTETAGLAACHSVYFINQQ